MNILFIHQNFPAQFQHLAPALAKLGGRVVALTMKQSDVLDYRGVALEPYTVSRGSTPGVHPWLVDFETKTIRAEACFRAALQLKRSGFTPDLIIAHPGWGESLFVKDVWPGARLAIYCEFYYRAEGGDIGFDPEFSINDDGDVCRLRLKNLNNLLHFEAADAGISPTEWQASTFPELFRRKITVIHEGIDTQLLAPDPSATLVIRSDCGQRIGLSRPDEVVTFVNRNLEPYRGYHIFMRALPELLQRRPNAKIIIVGGDRVGYGARPDPIQYRSATWKDIYIQEVRGQITDADWARVHFVGQLPYPYFVRLLQLTTVHVYMTYPFVLSWSLWEAMSVGCAIVASDTPPVREAITHNETGRLFDFFDPAALAAQVIELLSTTEDRERLGRNARSIAKAYYDLRSVCLPRQIEWVKGMLDCI